MSEQLDHKAAQTRKRDEREARRKAELKANMARRKAQVRGRAAQVADEIGAGAPDDNNE